MRKALVLLLCLALALPLLLPARAADSYLITVAEDTVLTDTSANGMAVYLDGIIYIPYTTLLHTDKVSARYDANGQFVTVWRSGLRAMMHFDLKTGTTYDSLNDRSVNISAKMRGDVPYLPLTIVAAWMEMYLHFTSADEAGLEFPVVRLCSSTPALTDQAVLRRNSATLKAVSDERSRLSGPVVEPPAVLPARDIALFFTQLPAPAVPAEGEAAPPQEESLTLPALLDVLEQYTLSAAFFLPEETLQTEGDALREIYCRGHAPGILLTDGEDPLSQARRGRELYAQQLHLRVRLVCPQGMELTENQQAALAADGFVVWKIDHDPLTPELTPSKAMTALRKALRDAPRQSVLLLPALPLTQEILPMLYSYLDAQNMTPVPVYEWTLPFVYQEVR